MGLPSSLFVLPPPPGVWSLLALPCHLLLLLLDQEPTSLALRELLCSLHIQIRYTMAYFFSHTAFFGFQWRTFLIFYAPGFVEKGHLNLKLFSQLYWIVFASFLAINYFYFPLSWLLRGDFPGQSTTARICTFVPLDAEKSEDVLKRNGIQMAGSFVKTFWILYQSHKVHKFLKGICPNKKMSCIGKYQRNAVDLRITALVSITWNMIAVMDVAIIFISIKFDLSPKTVSIIDSIIFVFVMEAGLSSFTLVLARRGLPPPSPAPASKLPDPPPRVLEPRRPVYQDWPCPPTGEEGHQLTFGKEKHYHLTEPIRIYLNGQDIFTRAEGEDKTFHDMGDEMTYLDLPLPTLGLSYHTRGERRPNLTNGEGRSFLKRGEKRPYLKSGERTSRPYLTIGEQMYQNKSEQTDCNSTESEKKKRYLRSREGRPYLTGGQ